MRIGLLSDVHANLFALRAAVARLRAEGVDAWVCAGDLVGYGPHPNETVALVRARAAVCLAGNHDLGVLGTISLDDFGGEAAVAARWTQSVLDADARSFLAALEPRGTRAGIGLYHGSPRDPVWEYVLDGHAALRSLEVAPERHVLVGHSHAALQISLDADGALGGDLAPAGTEVTLEDRAPSPQPGLGRSAPRRRPARRLARD